MPCKPADTARTEADGYTSVYIMCIVIRTGWRRMDSRELITALKGDGWYEVNHVGSHKQFKHPTKPGRVTVPHPKRDIPVGTLKSIEKQAGITFRRHR
jgi:predicted RNA binding protein YcfA (HicA-like mRNA interferase family)